MSEGILEVNFPGAEDARDAIQAMNVEDIQVVRNPLGDSLEVPINVTGLEDNVRALVVDAYLTHPDTSADSPPIRVRIIEDGNEIGSIERSVNNDGERLRSDDDLWELVVGINALRAEEGHVPVAVIDFPEVEGAPPPEPAPVIVPTETQEQAQFMLERLQQRRRNLRVELENLREVEPDTRFTQPEAEILREYARFAEDKLRDDDNGAIFGGNRMVRQHQEDFDRQHVDSFRTPREGREYLTEVTRAAVLVERRTHELGLRQAQQIALNNLYEQIDFQRNRTNSQNAIHGLTPDSADVPAEVLANGNRRSREEWQNTIRGERRLLQHAVGTEITQAEMDDYIALREMQMNALAYERKNEDGSLSMINEADVVNPLALQAYQTLNTNGIFERVQSEIIGDNIRLRTEDVQRLRDLYRTYQDVNVSGSRARLVTDEHQNAQLRAKLSGVVGILQRIEDQMETRFAEDFPQEIQLLLEQTDTVEEADLYNPNGSVNQGMVTELALSGARRDAQLFTEAIINNRLENLPPNLPQHVLETFDRLSVRAADVYNDNGTLNETTINALSNSLDIQEITELKRVLNENATDLRYPPFNEEMQDLVDRYGITLDQIEQFRNRDLFTEDIEAFIMQSGIDVEEITALLQARESSTDLNYQGAEELEFTLFGELEGEVNYRLYHNIAQLREVFDYYDEVIHSANGRLETAWNKFNNLSTALDASANQNLRGDLEDELEGLVVREAELQLIIDGNEPIVVPGAEPAPISPEMQALIDQLAAQQDQLTALTETLERERAEREAEREAREQREQEQTERKRTWIRNGAAFVGGAVLGALAPTVAAPIGIAAGVIAGTATLSRVFVDWRLRRLQNPDSWISGRLPQEQIETRVARFTRVRDTLEWARPATQMIGWLGTGIGLGLAGRAIYNSIVDNQALATNIGSDAAGADKVMTDIPNNPNLNPNRLDLGILKDSRWAPTDIGHLDVPMGGDLFATSANFNGGLNGMAVNRFLEEAAKAGIKDWGALGADSLTQSINFDKIMNIMYSGRSFTDAFAAVIP